MGPSLDERNCNTHPCPGQTCCQTAFVSFYFIPMIIYLPQLQIQILHINMHAFKEIQIVKFRFSSYMYSHMYMDCP